MTWRRPKNPALAREKRQATKTAAIYGRLTVGWIGLTLTADRHGDPAKGDTFEDDAARTAAMAWHAGNERLALDDPRKRPATTGRTGGR